IVDFGLAKLSSETALTREGTTVGTIAYMSPEQAKGHNVDHRTDIWSLGAVLYEMVTGRRAFSADHDSAQLYLIINEDPAPVQTLRPDVPDALAVIIHRMLEKDAGARFASMDEVVAALDKLRSITPADATAPMRSGDALVRAREALARYDWSRAFTAYCEADAEVDLSAQDLEGMGLAGQWTRHTEGANEAWERAHAKYVCADRPADAARIAIELSHVALGSGQRSVCNGWLKRAENLLANLPDAVENGYLARAKAQIAIEADIELDAAMEFAATAMAFAERHGDSDLRALALQDRGRALVLKNQVTEGMELIEEAMSLAMSGELSSMVVGSTYCNMISMCDRIADYRRAGEWSDSAVRWCEPHSESGFHGICSVHRAVVMRVRGDWKDAQGEAERAIENSDGYLPAVAGEAFYLMGEIRTRRGEFGDAETSFQEAHQRGRQPDPGLALLRLAQGNVEASRALIDRALSADLIALDRIKLLPAGVEIALAAGRIDTARTRADELQSLADGYASIVFLGHAAHAAGAVKLAQGNAEEALTALTGACSHWKAADMPYDDARTRALKADAYWSTGDNDLANLEARTARAVFARLGARADLDRIDASIERHS
ncbi:MAG: protein kinase, partial [Deltaproteobacteria bacterium]|nr:protein kinase [Deltaproteobacteria bacterium]